MSRRLHCNSCDYPQVTCVCAWVNPQTVSARVVVIQDRLEQRQAKSTVPLLRLALPELSCVRADDPVAMQALRETMTIDPTFWGLVYPGSNAIPVDTAEGKGRSLSVQWPAVWVLPDGTWRKTRRLLLEHSWLNQLPRYSFAHPPPSQYHIRKVPIGGALSTLESVAWLLANVSTLDPEPLYRLQAAMVQQWQGHQPVAHRRHNTVWPF